MYWNLYVIKPGNYAFPVVHCEDDNFMVCGDQSGHYPTNLTDEGLIAAMKHVRLCYVGEFVSFNVIAV